MYMYMYIKSFTGSKIPTYIHVYTSFRYVHGTCMLSFSLSLSLQSPPPPSPLPSLSAQCLGFLDLHQLALHSRPRRAQVFSLDYDGKPAVWEVVSRDCMAVMRSLASRLGSKEADTTATPTPSPLTPSPLSNGGEE